MPAPNWQASTLPAAGNWTSVKYGDGRFIAYSSTSAVAAYSDDRGASWQSLTMPTIGVVALEYLDGVWYAISVYNGTTATGWRSVNGGLTWSIWTLPDRGNTNINYYWSQLFVCNNRLYILQSGGYTNAYYTTDGASWVPFFAPFASSKISMAYGNGVYIMSTTGNSVAARSTDGVTWTTHSIVTTTNNWRGLCFGKGMFVMVNYDTTMIVRSADGITWTATTVPRRFWEMAAFGSGTFVAIASSTNNSGVYWSDDGVTWTLASPNTSCFMSVAYGDGAFILVPYAYYGGNTAAGARAWYNRPPNPPSSITYGQPKAGEALAVTAAAATDTDGDAIVSYFFERSIDGGSFVQIYIGSSRTITDTVPASGGKIQYRVKVTDTSGAASDYRTGESVSIYYNQPPEIPTSISFGPPKAGKTLAITCAAVTDPESDSITYVWERSIDGGIWSQIGITSVNGFIGTVPTSGTTYNVRVKAVDIKGNESGYRVGSAQNIEYNVPPTIAGTDEDKGTVSGPFSYAYTVADQDAGDILTVVEKLDGVEIKRFTATSGTQYTADFSAKWQSLAAGSHQLVITVTDQDGESAARTITFSWTVTRIAAQRVITLSAMPKKVFLSLFPQPAAGTATITCQVSNNPFDDSPVWEDISEEINNLVHVFTNGTATATQKGLAYRFTIAPAAGQTVTFSTAVVRYV